MGLADDRTISCVVVHNSTHFVIVTRSHVHFCIFILTTLLCSCPKTSFVVMTHWPVSGTSQLVISLPYFSGARNWRQIKHVHFRAGNRLES